MYTKKKKKQRRQQFLERNITTIAYAVIFLVFMIIVLVIANKNAQTKVVKVEGDKLATSWNVSEATTAKETEATTTKSDAENQEDTTASTDGTATDADSNATETTEQATEAEETTVAATEEDTTAADGLIYTIVDTADTVSIYAEPDQTSTVLANVTAGYSGSAVWNGVWWTKVTYQGVTGWIESSYVTVQ
jgi:cytoskeletal protein RodZ